MAITLEGTLNWAIPLLVLLIFAAIMYNKLKEPIDNFFGLIWRGIAKAKDKVAEGSNPRDTVYEKVIVYE